MSSDLNVTKEEKSAITKQLGNKISPLSWGVAKLYVSQDSHWAYTGVWGAVTVSVNRDFDCDPKPYVVHMFDLQTAQMKFQQEMYENMRFDQLRDYFVVFECEQSVVGLLFASDDQGREFHSRASSLAKSVKCQAGADGGSISRPTNFKHVAHVGFDSEQGFMGLDSIPTEWKQMFKSAGIKKSDLKNTETAREIYNIIQQHKPPKPPGPPPPPASAPRSIPTLPPRTAPSLPPSRGAPRLPPPLPGASAVPVPPPVENYNEYSHEQDQYQQDQYQQDQYQQDQYQQEQDQQYYNQEHEQYQEVGYDDGSGGYHESAAAGIPVPPPVGAASIPVPPPVGAASIPAPPPVGLGSIPVAPPPVVGASPAPRPPVPASPVSATPGRVDLLSEIRKGKQLRKVTDEEKEEAALPAVSAMSPTASSGLLGALQAAMMSRRAQIHTDANDDADEWSD